MTNNNLQQALELNREAKNLLAALGTDYEQPPDPRGRSRIEAAFDPSDTSGFAGLSDEEAAAWIIQDTAKALKAAAEAADRRHNPTGLDAVKAALGGGV